MQDTYSRRNFLRLSAALLAGGAAVMTGAPERALGMGTISGRGEPGGLAPISFVKGFCSFCQARCTYQAQVRNGMVESFIGEKDNRWTGGSMCPKGLSVIELINSPYRLTEPMLRQPDGSWKRISYEEAVRITASKVRECLEKHGSKAGDRMALTMPLWDSRESELAAEMTLHLAGCVHMMPPGETCTSTASNMLTSLTGTGNCTTTVNELCNAHTVVLWGANINDLYPPYTRWLEMAKARGVKLVYIDPRRTRTSLWCTTQLQPLPGTDGALALGAIRYVFEHGAFDETKARALITDLDKLREDAAPYTPEKVQEITGVPADEAVAFYAALAESPRTILWLGGALSRYTTGIQTVRALIVLQALTDNIFGSGRGIMTMQSGKPGGDDEFVDALLGPLDKAKMNFRRLRMAMEKGNIDVLFLNCSYRRYPDCDNVRKAIEKVPFVVHRGFFMTEETEASDLFIPAVFSPESQGSGYGNEKQVVWREKIVEAPGSCVPDWQFYRDLGIALFGDRYPGFKDPADLYERFVSIVPSWKGMTLDRLRKSPDGLVWPIYEPNGEEHLGNVFRDGKLLTPEGTMTVQDRVFGRIKWTYPKGSPLGKERDEKYPLVLTQGKVLWHWQQTLTNFSRELAQYTEGRFVSINPETAAKYKLAQGEKVLIETFVGSLEAWVDIRPEIIPGVIFTPSHCTASSPLEQNRSPHINTILPNYWDRISCQHNGVGCALRKIDAQPKA